MRPPTSGWHAAYRIGSDAEIKAACQQVLVLHSSTRERLPILDSFYPRYLCSHRPSPDSILDLGCGLNPLALPWMGLPADAPRYIALDIDAERISFLNRYLAAGWAGAAGPLPGRSGPAAGRRGRPGLAAQDEPLPGAPGGRAARCACWSSSTRPLSW